MSQVCEKSMVGVPFSLGEDKQIYCAEVYITTNKHFKNIIITQRILKMIPNVLGLPEETRSTVQRMRVRVFFLDVFRF